MKKIWTFVLFCTIQSIYPVKVEEIMDGVYAGQGVAVSGEPVYFGMEKVTEENRKKWQAYRDIAYNRMTLDSRGLMCGIALYCSPEKRTHWSAQQIEEVFGFTAQEYEQYCDYLYEHGFDKNKKHKTLCIGGGAVGFEPTTTYSSYVAYASKSPVQGCFPFFKDAEDRTITLNRFNEAYNDLLISVGSWNFDDNGDCRYINRGIFRNPKTIIDGGYTGLSLKLHGFTAAVAKKYFPDKKYMAVAASPTMYRLIEKHLKDVAPPEAYIGKEAFLKEAKGILEPGGSSSDTPCAIAVDPLIQFYDPEYTYEKEE